MPPPVCLPTFPFPLPLPGPAAWMHRQLTAGQEPTSPLTGAPLDSFRLRENRIARLLIGSLQAAGQLGP